MKLNLHIGQAPLAGYKNIDAAQTNLDLANLDNFCYSAECTSIIVNDLLKYMPYDKMPIVVQHLASKLRHKGGLTLIFTDLNSIIKEYQRGNVDEKLLNTLVFGQGSRSCFSYTYIVNILKVVKLEIKSIDISTEQVVIVAERP